MIPLFYPYIPKQKILQQISDTLDSRWIGQGPKVEDFEKKFGKKMGYKYPVMLNSATSALELAYHLVGLKKDDVVIVPVLNAICGQVGLVRRECKILFCDVQKATLNIDPVHLEKLLTKNKVKAVVGVHLGGIHFDKNIYSLCKKFKVPLIVDSAQYLAPTKGDYICYSFQAIKHITTGDGGMLILNNKSDYERAKELRWFGIPRKFKKTWKKRGVTTNIKEAGYKYQPTDIDACFALAAWPDVDKILKHRSDLVSEYKKGLGNLDEVEVIAGDACWLLTILAAKRDQLADYLTKAGIESNLVHVRNDSYKIFSKKRLSLPNMDFIEKSYLCLPINSVVKKSDVKFICESIKKFYKT